MFTITKMLFIPIIEEFRRIISEYVTRIKKENH